MDLPSCYIIGVIAPHPEVENLCAANLRFLPTHIGRNLGLTQEITNYELDLQLTEIFQPRWEFLGAEESVWFAFKHENIFYSLSGWYMIMCLKLSYEGERLTWIKIPCHIE